MSIDARLRIRAGRALCLPVLLPALVLALACARGGPGEDASDGESAEILKQIDVMEQQDPSARSQVDIGLHARWKEPGVMAVGITNKTRQPVTIMPEFFAVIVPPSRDVHEVNKASRKRFPVTRLEPGQSAGGELIFPERLMRPGARLVFQAPEVRPAMAVIEP